MSQLEFREDFETVKQNWARFWDGTLGRPILLAVAPKNGVEAIAKPPWGAAFSHGAEQVVDQVLGWAQTHEFLGDAVPFYYPSLIIDLFPAFLGAEIITIEEAWGADTHAVPCIQDLSSAEITFQRDSIWWQRWVELAECFRSTCAGRVIYGIGAPFYNNLDTLAALRGNVELMTDLYDNPEGVHHTMRQIMAAYTEVTDEVCRLLDVETYGSTTGHGFYCDGRTGTPQCDFGFNIGKEHFDEFAFPYLREEIDLHDVVEYHLDGPGNIKHLESICTIEKVRVVQWVPGAGDAPQQDWSSLFERINELGKGLWLSAGSPDDAVALWQKYNNSGRMILHVHAPDRDAMARYLDAFEKLGGG